MGQKFSFWAQCNWLELFSFSKTGCHARIKSLVYFTTYLPSRLRCRIHGLLLCRGVRPHPMECPGYDPKQSDGEVSVMQVLWWMRSITPLTLLPGTLWLGMQAPDRTLSMRQIEQTVPTNDWCQILENIKLSAKRAQARLRMLCTKCVCVCVCDLTLNNPQSLINNPQLLIKPNRIFKMYKGFGICGGTRGVMVIVVVNGHGDMSSNPGRDIVFYIALIPLGKVWIKLFSLQLWANSRADWFLVRQLV